MFHSKSIYLERLLLTLDLVISALVFIWFLVLYPTIRQGQTVDFGAHIGLLLMYLVTFTLARQALQRESSGFSLMTIAGQAKAIILETAVAVAICMVLIFVLKLEFVSRFVIVGFISINTTLLLATRMILNWWYFSKGIGKEEYDLKVLIIGSGRRARMLADSLSNQRDWGVRVVGFLDPRGESAGRRRDDKILGAVSEISSVLRDNVVEEVIVAVPRGMIGDVQEIIDACQEEGVRLSFMADFYDLKVARTRLTSVDGIPLLSFEPVARAENALLAKRIFDLIVTLLAAPLLVPIFIVVAIVIRLDSPGPAFFKQSRIGLHKRRFNLYKFRSMSVDAEEKIKDLEHLNEADGPNFKIKNDPRITRVGRFLRKSSIDELPQLINVLIGDMSLVGPRPMSIRDVSLFDKGRQRKRFSVRPGITCLWQVSGRSNLSFEDWLNLDLQYIDSWSFWLDVKILLRTIPTVLRGTGAA